MSKPVIILLDDDLTVLSSVTNQLKRHFGFKFRYEQTSSKTEAWEVIGQRGAEQIALIISDWVMPEQNGDVFLREVTAKHPHIKQIMLSGFADEEKSSLAKENTNCIALIRKPWEEEELIAAVNQVLLPSE